MLHLTNLRCRVDTRFIRLMRLLRLLSLLRVLCGLLLLERRYSFIISATLGGNLMDIEMVLLLHLLGSLMLGLSHHID